MIGINHITIAGNLTRDPQTRFLADQRAVANFGLACNRRDKVDGQMREQVTFVDCDCWGRTAETISKYFKKGKPIIVEGRESYANPLPHVLILTAIVVGISTTAVGLALVVRIHQAFGTIEENEIQDLDRDD